MLTLVLLELCVVQRIRPLLEVIRVETITRVLNRDDVHSKQSSDVIQQLVCQNDIFRIRMKIYHRLRGTNMKRNMKAGNVMTYVFLIIL